jgi:hypothetical protein
MECIKIKSLLSEYMDKTLENDTQREVKEHLLSCKDCSNDYFLIKSIAEKMKSMESYKAPSNLLNKVNLAIQKRPWYLRLPAFIPGSGGFRLPMEYVTLAATAMLVFFIFTSIYMDKPKDVMTADSGNSKTRSDSNRGNPVDLEFIPVSGKGTDAVTSDNTFSVSSGQAFNDSKIPDILKMPGMDSPSVKHEMLLSRLNELINKAGGDIVSKEHKGTPENIDAITVSIPLKSYDSFIQKAEEIGRFHPPAPALADKTADPVLMHIKFNISE